VLRAQGVRYKVYGVRYKVQGISCKEKGKEQSAEGIGRKNGNRGVWDYRR
jgi:hypothetical protein